MITAPRKLIAGSPADRLSGLDPLLAAAQGLSVLDIGCHKGYVSYAFACAGASSICGFDSFAAGIETARSYLSDFEIPLRLEVFDFANGLPPNLPATFDVVLYLGVHHHLARQIGMPELQEFVLNLLHHCGRYFAARTADEYLAVIDMLATEDRFVLRHHSGLNRVVSPVRIYERMQQARN